MNSITGFVLGVALGFLLSGILFQVVTSAVDTVVVCFAEAPNPLRLNHPPELSERMVQAWRAVYPMECHDWNVMITPAQESTE